MGIKSTFLIRLDSLTLKNMLVEAPSAPTSEPVESAESGSAAMEALPPPLPRPAPAPRTTHNPHCQAAAMHAAAALAAEPLPAAYIPVSYTHLTLPTIYSV